MPAAGYKLFVTGDVLTAAQVNDYLMLQTVMVFANSAARTSALSGVLAEGLVSYLKDTDVVEIYTGAAWVSLDDPNAIQNSIVDAKGDLISATADNTPARLAVGTNAQVLTADSTTATGLKWATPATATSKVVQIVQGTYSTGVGTSSTTFVDTGLTATITPTSASNKVLAFVNLNGVAISTANGGHYAEWQLNIRAGAATSSIGARVGINGSLNASQWGAWGISTVYFDSPATTSACVYKVQYLVSNAASQAIIGSGSPLQTITLMEVTP